MAHLMGAAAQRGADAILTDWLQHANSASMHTVALGSGAVVGTFDVSGGVVKGLMMTTYNTPAFSVRDNQATLAAFGSGEVGAQIFQPVFWPYKNTLTINKLTGTAETWYALVATSQKDMANAI